MVKKKMNPLEIYLEENGWSVRAFAERNKFRYQTVLDIVSGKRKPHRTTLFKIMQATNFEIIEDDMFKWYAQNRKKTNPQQKGRNRHRI